MKYALIASASFLLLACLATMVEVVLRAIPQ